MKNKEGLMTVGLSSLIIFLLFVVAPLAHYVPSSGTFWVTTHADGFVDLEAERWDVNLGNATELWIADGGLVGALSIAYVEFKITEIPRNSEVTSVKLWLDVVDMPWDNHTVHLAITWVNMTVNEEDFGFHNVITEGIKVSSGEITQRAWWWFSFDEFNPITKNGNYCFMLTAMTQNVFTIHLAAREHPDFKPPQLEISYG